MLTICNRGKEMVPTSVRREPFGPPEQSSSGFSAAKIWFKNGQVILQLTLRFTNSGTPVINLSVANNRSVKIGEERQSVADWFKVTVFGRDAEVIAQYAKKGSALAFNGRLQ